MLIFIKKQWFFGRVGWEGPIVLEPANIGLEIESNMADNEIYAAIHMNDDGMSYGNLILHHLYIDIMYSFIILFPKYTCVVEGTLLSGRTTQQ